MNRDIETFFSNIITLKNLSDTDIVPAGSSLIKLGEEYGELCAAYLKRERELNASASAEDNLEEEIVDTIMCALDIAFKSQISVTKLNETMHIKLQKWANKIKNTQSNSIY